MKKLLVCCLLLFLLALPAAADPLPDGLRGALGQAAVAASACWEEPGLTTWFVLTRSQEGVNTLHCFTCEGGAWTEAFRTHQAIPQGEERVDLHLSEGVWHFDGVTGARQYLPGPMLLILQHGADSGEVRQLLCFQRTEPDAWSLIALNIYPEAIKLWIDGSAVTWYAAADKGQLIPVGTASCSFDSDLRRLRLQDVPLTFPCP